jgi:type II secretory pathway pseudopilin PulG
MMSTVESIRARRRTEAGYSFPALFAALAIMGLALLLAIPSWNYLAHDDKEQELIFRGRQISAAIARFQRKNGNALPTSFDQLVQGKYLRRAYKDPMTTGGQWRVLRPGEGAPRPPISAPGGRPTPTPTPQPTPAFGGNSGTQTGPMAGVASRSTESSIRLVNGNSTYNLWLFGPNIPFIIGGQSPAGGPPRGPNQAPAQPALRAPDAEAPRLSR